ncbi:MAG: extracellular solute-binding protein [Acidobacteria bacterium]|nr:extracellular solute-binding protein [Acidobacteriota bacterium]MYE43820.1 extracellular solute-binding protein [Acidobacteriota bacterium]
MKTGRRRRHRRRTARTLCLLLALGLPLGCGGRADEDLVIAVPPGRIADLEDYFAGPFEAATGARLIPVGLRSADQAARVRVERGNPSLDVLWIDAGEAALLAREGLLETPFDPETSREGELRVPNAAWADPDAWFSQRALPATFSSAIGFLYNTEHFASPPASWAALEDPALEGRLALFGFGSTLGPLTVAALARIDTADETDADAGFRRLGRLRNNVLVYGTSGPANNQLVAQGEAWLTLGLPSQARHLATEGAPVGWAAPAEGAIALPQGIQIVTGTRRPELARAFADYMFSSEAQQTAARELQLVPSRSETEIPPGLPPSETLMRLDMVTLGDLRPSWATRFRREMIP